MLTVQRIARRAALGQFDSLLDELIRNGRPLPVAARARLADPRSAALSALALGTQRALELTYAPDQTLLGLVDQLIDLVLATVRDAESAPAAERAGPGSLAAAARAMSDLLTISSDRGWVSIARGPMAERIRAGLGAIGYLLFVAQAGTAARQPRDAGLVGDCLDSALVIWQFTGGAGLSARVDPPLNLSQLHEAAERRGLWRDADCAAVLALAGTPLTAPRPARAA